MRRLTVLLLIFLASTLSLAEVDLRAPPETEPQLEEVPQSGSILSPIVNLVQNYRGFELPYHYSDCFKPTIRYFGKRYAITLHCTLLDAHASTIGLIAVLMWAILGFSIIMSA